MEIISKTEKQTVEIAKKFCKSLKGNEFIALYGNLGAGKTLFAKSIIKNFIPDANVSSPTFALVNEYQNGKLNIYHFDMYRINNWDDLYSIGFFDYLNKNALIITEWSENIENVIPEDAIKIKLKSTNNINERIINIGD